MCSVLVLNAERGQGFKKWCNKNDQKVKHFILEPQQQTSKFNLRGQSETQLRDWLVAGMNIRNLDKELVQKHKKLLQEIKTPCVFSGSPENSQEDRN